MKRIESMGLRTEGDHLLALDQQRLPNEEIWLPVLSPDDMVHMIQQLKVRGAPLIGVAAALALAKYAETDASDTELEQAAVRMRKARPTAVNLMAAVDRLTRVPRRDWVRVAEQIFDEDVELCRRMGENGASLIKDGDNILHHCNTGGLATVGIGTALGAILTAHRQGKKIHVYVDETRPLLQGARLTAWELAKNGIPHTLICDNMAASLMRAGKIHKVFVGSDRIARNGDFANKIGTYSAAVLAHHHKVEMYCVAPYTTVDMSKANGTEIPIEERHAEEVKGPYRLDTTKVYNPSFDVTPVELLTALVLDRGVFTREQLKSGALSIELGRVLA